MKRDVFVYSVFTNTFGFIGCFSNRTQLLNHLESLGDKFEFNYYQLRDKINACNVGEFVDLGKYRIYKTFMNKGSMIKNIF